VVVQVMEQYGVDVNDLHFHFRDPVRQYERRVKDGIHWDPIAHRSISHLILMHICRAWDLPAFSSSGPQRRPGPRRLRQRAATQDGRVMTAPFSSSASTHNHTQQLACASTQLTSPFADDIPLPGTFSASHEVPAQYPPCSSDAELSSMLQYLETSIQLLYDTEQNNQPCNQDWHKNASIQGVLEECTTRLSYVNGLGETFKAFCYNQYECATLALNQWLLSSNVTLRSLDLTV
jgi:hypothetical protein